MNEAARKSVLHRPDDVTRAKREPAVGLTTLAARKSRQHAVIER